MFIFSFSSGVISIGVHLDGIVRNSRYTKIPNCGNTKQEGIFLCRMKKRGNNVTLPLLPIEMFSSVPSSFPPLKTATKPNLKNQPPYAAVSTPTKPLHMVVFSSLKVVLPPQGMKNPRFLDRGGSF